MPVQTPLENQALNLQNQSARRRVSKDYPDTAPGGKGAQGNLSLWLEIEYGEEKTSLFVRRSDHTLTAGIYMAPYSIN